MRLCGCRTPRSAVAVMDIDDASERPIVGLFVDMPVGGPGKLADRVSGRSFGHAGQAHVRSIGKHDREQRLDLGWWPPATQMCEGAGEVGPAIDFGEQLGDAHAGQGGIEPAGEGLGLLGLLQPLYPTDSQAMLVDHGVRQGACPSSKPHLPRGSYDFARTTPPYAQGGCRLADEGFNLYHCPLIELVIYLVR